jgi:hypothetical protein
VCLLPPSAQELGWQSNAGGGFKQHVAALLGMEADDVQAMVLLGVPICAVEQAERMGQAMFTLAEPSNGLTFLQRTEDGDVVYSNAHIAKVWTLEATALTDARQALINVRAGKEMTDAFAGKTADEIEQVIEKHLDATGAEVAATTTTTSMEEGVPPTAAAETTDSVHAEVQALRAALEKEKQEKAKKDEQLAEQKAIAKQAKLKATMLVMQREGGKFAGNPHFVCNAELASTQ